MTWLELWQGTLGRSSHSSTQPRSIVSSGAVHILVSQLDIIVCLLVAQHTSLLRHTGMLACHLGGTVAAVSLTEHVCGIIFIDKDAILSLAFSGTGKSDFMSY